MLANKIRNEEEMHFIESRVDSLPIIGCIPWDEDILRAGMGRGVSDIYQMEVFKKIELSIQGARVK